MTREESTGVAVTHLPDMGGLGEHAQPLRRPQLIRFRIGVAILGLLALVALGTAAALSATSQRTLSQSAWSPWGPPDGGVTGAQEIADYLAPYYRATPGQQLAVVTAVNLNDPAHPLQVVVPSDSSDASLIPLPAASTIVYNLCGEGSTDCSIGAGHPSQARLLLLRREALELALYTFRYISSTQTVVAILPPGRVSCTGLCPEPSTAGQPAKAQMALAFERSELEPWINNPLQTTLPEPLPPTVSQMENAPEAELVSIITAHGLFQERSQQGQDGSTMLVLTPMAPQ